MTSPVTIKKLDVTADVLPGPPAKTDITKLPEFGGKKKTLKRSFGGGGTGVPKPLGGGGGTRTFPRGILKTARRHVIKPVSDPAKPPPIKKYMKKHTIRLMTDRGLQNQRKTIRKQIGKMSDTKVKQLVSETGLLKNGGTPVPVMREMLEGGVIAGFISLD